MASSARAMVAPAYLFACLILGGSAQGIWANMILQLGGIAIVAWAAMARVEDRLSPAGKYLLVLAVLSIALVGLQMIPLPPSIWTTLGPRQRIAEGFAILGLPIASEPLSLTPAAGLDSLLGIIPPLAIVCAMLRLNAYRPQWLAIALIAGAVGGIGLGALQVASADPVTSHWYLYADTNPGKAVGFFANADHMAILLVVTIPFLAAFAAGGKRGGIQRHAATVAVAAALVLLVLVGLALNGSLAGYGLALPVIAASTLLVLPARSRLRSLTALVAMLLAVGAIALVEITPIGSGKIAGHASNAVQSRTEIAATAARATAKFMPFGSGLGSFDKVYRLYERPAQVTPIFVVHAHDDYLELTLELGLAGALLILLFLAWWVVAVWRAWRTAGAGPFARAAAIGSAAILVHSAVDFPLRTAAIAACFGMCLALLAESRAAPPVEEGELRFSRHIVI